MKALLCAYRDWARAALDEVVTRHPDKEFFRASTPGELEAMTRLHVPDVVVVVGWSWRVPDDVLNAAFVVGMHPSALPEYAGGSPLQHQIIDGLRESRATLFRLTSELDAGAIVDSVPLSLEGHMDEVLRAVSEATVGLVSRFLCVWPDVKTHAQRVTRTRKRLRPQDSLLTRDSVSSMTCRQLWDVIRCREDPYPNVYLEDETGRLVIKRAEFEPK